MKPRRVASLATAAALVVAALTTGPFNAFTAPAAAAGGSTPGVIVTATNPSGPQLGSDLKLALTAHSESSTLPDASCRPEDMTLKCWGSLVLRVPKFGDLAVGDFEVHRVSVGATGCDDGCEDGGMLAIPATGAPVNAQVNGVGFVKWSGNSGLAVGTKVQVKLTLTDNGSAPYTDQVVVQINRFVEGPDKPLLYRSGLETIRQVVIRYVDTDG